jgi:hypothetical protein
MAQLSAESYVEDLKEMYRLVEPGESRTVLFCIEIAGQVGLQEPRRSLLSQTERYTQNGNALMLGLAYVAGACESDRKAVVEGNQGPEVLAALFQDQCMPLLLR